MSELRGLRLAATDGHQCNGIEPTSPHLAPLPGRGFRSSGCCYYDEASDEAAELARHTGSYSGMLCTLFVIGLLVVSAILMAVWVIRDCRNRSVENGFLWMFLIMGTHFIGLLVYLASRP